jgi:hypothetical protein
MDRKCATEGCQRVAVTDWAYCATHIRELLDVRRVGTRPRPQITEAEMRLLWGDR